MIQHAQYLLKTAHEDSVSKVIATRVQKLVYMAGKAVERRKKFLGLLLTNPVMLSWLLEVFLEVISCCIQNIMSCYWHCLRG